MRRRLGFVVGSGALVLAVACGSGGGGGGGNQTCSVSAVSVTANPPGVLPGETSSLGATVTSWGSCGGGVTWTAAPPTGILAPSGLTATFSLRAGLQTEPW
jgi:hypothetical protein